VGGGSWIPETSTSHNTRHDSDGPRHDSSRTIRPLSRSAVRAGSTRAARARHAESFTGSGIREGACPLRLTSRQTQPAFLEEPAPKG
jgi:hypothetical protein